MKTFIKISTILILTTINFTLTNAQHEEVDNILIEQTEGIRFFVADSLENFTDTSKIKCHPAGLHNGQGHPIFLEFRPSYQASDNRVVIYESGLMGIGVEDPCLRYSDDIVQFDSIGVKLLLQTGKALRADGVSDWDIPSDIRLKKDINTFNDGLEVINKINPIRYKYNGEGGTINNTNAIGISAQEMEKIAPYTVKKAPSSQDSYYTYNGSALRYVIINAIKELSTENDLLKEQFHEQQTEINLLKENINKLNTQMEEYFLKNEIINHKNINSNLNSKTSLKQNIPNPFQSSTTISYILPDGTVTAKIIIHDARGSILKSIDLETNNQNGILEINPEKYSLSSGTYFYSLLINDELISTKKMILIEE